MIIWNASISEVCGGPDAASYFCIRYVTLTLVASFTGLLCACKIGKYHYHRVKCPYQLAIFYCALLECVAYILHWTLYAYDLIENIGYWFRVLQLLIVCFNYSKLACRVLNREDLYKRRFLPVLTVFAVYYLALVPWMITIRKYKYPHKCTEFHHPCYTASDFVLSQVRKSSPFLWVFKM